MRTVKFTGLSTGPLPFGNLVGSVFVTIWLVSMLFLVYCFRHVIYGRYRAEKPWDQFRNIFWGAVVITLWYILLVIDRWLRYRGYTVKTHYILLQPLAEPLRVASSLLLLSGTFNVIWRRKSHREHRTWVLFNKILFLAVAVASFFYLLLFLAVAACWLDFTSLNTIMDLAGRRNQFELSSAVLFTVYSLFVVLAAGKVYNSGRKVEGRTRITSTNNFILYIAFLLFCRCAVELGITAWAYGPTKNRQRIQVGQDIAYGAITTIALGIMAWLADDLQPYDGGVGPGPIIKSNIRGAVLRILERDTMQRCKPPPPLMDILRRLEDEFQRRTDSQRVFSGTALGGDEPYEIALGYVRELKEKEGSRRPPRAARDPPSSASQAAPSGTHPFARPEFQSYAGAGSSRRSSRTLYHRAADSVRIPTQQHQHQYQQPQQTRNVSVPITLGRDAPPAAAAAVFNPPSGDRIVSDGSRNPYWRHLRPAANGNASVRSAGGQMWDPAESIEMGFRSEMWRDPGRSP